MARLLCWGLTLLALTLMVQTGSSEGPKPVKGLANPLGNVYLTPPSAPTAPDDRTCVIYSLAELGNDPDLGRWIAETIPEVIAPGTWNRLGKSGKKQVLRYYGPKKMLVVYHTAAVQAKVDGFLKNVKKALPEGKERTVTAAKTFANDRGVVPARFLAPAVLKPANPVPEPNSSYPIPAPARQPKHLFHFIIRYEGAGIIDDNVIKFWKLQNDQKAAAAEADKPKEKEDKESSAAVPASPIATPASGVRDLPPTQKMWNNLPPSSTAPVSVETVVPADRKEKEDKKPLLP